MMQRIKTLFLGQRTSSTGRVEETHGDELPPPSAADQDHALHSAVTRENSGKRVRNLVPFLGRRKGGNSKFASSDDTTQKVNHGRGSLSGRIEPGEESVVETAMDAAKAMFSDTVHLEDAERSPLSISKEHEIEPSDLLGASAFQGDIVHAKSTLSKGATPVDLYDNVSPVVAKGELEAITPEAKSPRDLGDVPCERKRNSSEDFKHTSMILRDWKTLLAPAAPERQTAEGLGNANTNACLDSGASAAVPGKVSEPKISTSAIEEMTAERSVELGTPENALVDIVNDAKQVSLPFDETAELEPKEEESGEVEQKAEPVSEEADVVAEKPEPNGEGLFSPEPQQVLPVLPQSPRAITESSDPLVLSRENTGNSSKVLPQVERAAELFGLALLPGNIDEDSENGEQVDNAVHPSNAKEETIAAFEAEAETWEKASGSAPRQAQEMLDEAASGNYYANAPAAGSTGEPSENLELTATFDEEHENTEETPCGDDCERTTPSFLQRVLETVRKEQPHSSQNIEAVSDEKAVESEAVTTSAAYGATPETEKLVSLFRKMEIEEMERSEMMRLRDEFLSHGRLKSLKDLSTCVEEAASDHEKACTCETCQTRDRFRELEREELLAREASRQRDKFLMEKRAARTGKHIAQDTSILSL
ncbi:hypothetical protein FVE85_1669 [Porphyridium purpureum]|uniref:Uncharacterized protein n=1 Tax=Porphyridium purpureum TaxID=35688 RepID=A0A5J4YXW3_PORPP|nr:hypothetical protein FVE85_1669 [Porphyridium purpureum]|eukprot:POR6030..scf209_3